MAISLNPQHLNRYPQIAWLFVNGLAILLFLAAAGGGVVLLINILFYDKGEE